MRVRFSLRDSGTSRMNRRLFMKIGRIAWIAESSRAAILLVCFLSQLRIRK